MPQPRSFPTDAIVLKQTDLGETDRILTLFTPYKGKMHAVAKGIRRPISKKAGHLELLCHSQLYIAVGRNLDIITQVQTIESFGHLRSELWHMTCGFYLAELIDRFIEDDTQHLDIYQLLLEVLRTIENDAAAFQAWRANGKPVESQPSKDRTLLALRYFEIALLSFIGYEPMLRTCAHCHTELQPQENGFNATLGGAICPNCSQFWKHAISMNALKVLRLLQRTSWEKVPHFRFDMQLHTEVEATMQELLRFHLERDLKSWSFLHMLNTSMSADVQV